VREDVSRDSQPKFNGAPLKGNAGDDQKIRRGPRPCRQFRYLDFYEVNTASGVNYVVSVVTLSQKNPLYSDTLSFEIISFTMAARGKVKASPHTSQCSLQARRASYRAELAGLNVTVQAAGQTLAVKTDTSTLHRVRPWIVIGRIRLLYIRWWQVTQSGE
jgi:hypothetical protein